MSNGLKDLEEFHPPVAAVIESAHIAGEESNAAYLCYMATRLLEIHRVMKPAGSLYLHCDQTIRPLLAGDFCPAFSAMATMALPVSVAKSSGGEPTPKVWPSGVIPINHDTILYYSKGETFTYNRPYRPHDPEYVEKFYRYVEPETGRRYQLD